MSLPPRQVITLRDLPLAGRVTLAAFLISVGIGYFSALVQLHAQQAKPGQTLPGEQEVIDTYHGRPGVGALERLITADQSLPFSSGGTMRPAFTTQSTDWIDDTFEQRAIKNFLGKLDDAPEDDKDKKEKLEEWEKLSKEEKAKKIEAAKHEIRRERLGEAAVLVEWIHVGLDVKAFRSNAFHLPDALKDKPLTPKFLKINDDGSKSALIASIFRARCIRCHQPGRDAEFAPMVKYEQIVGYSKKGSGEGGLPLRKLAQSSHVHLLGFSVLYGLSGLIFACSSWPGILRILIAPMALVAQVVDISFWWLARLHEPYGPEFAKCIRFSGMVVATSLGLQIVLSLFSLFSWLGRFVLLLLFVLALVGAYYLNDLVIGPYLAEQAKLVSP